MTTLATLARRTAVTVAVLAAGLAMSVPPAVGAPNDAAQARRATAGFHHSTVITSNPDWFQLFDLQGITCIDSPVGAMGIHFVNGARLADPAERAAEPEAVIYEPTRSGRLRLVGVEYVVTKQAWEEAGNTGVPRLFGHDFLFVPAGNRYGLPDFYALHAWIWKHNPDGMHKDWNPRVTCAYAH